MGFILHRAAGNEIIFASLLDTTVIRLKLGVSRQERSVIGHSKLCSCFSVTNTGGLSALIQGVGLGLGVGGVFLKCICPPL